MATRGRPLSAGTVRHIKMLRTALSIRKTAKEAQVARNTVRKYTR